MTRKRRLRERRCAAASEDQGACRCRHHPWSILKALEGEGAAAAPQASLLPARWTQTCHACANYGGDHYQFFQTLFLQAPERKNMTITQRTLVSCHKAPCGMVYKLFSMVSMVYPMDSPVISYTFCGTPWGINNYITCFLR